jgi:hypothetical protein
MQEGSFRWEMWNVKQGWPWVMVQCKTTPLMNAFELNSSIKNIRMILIFFKEVLNSNTSTWDFHSNDLRNKLNYLQIMIFLAVFNRGVWIIHIHDLLRLMINMNLQSIDFICALSPRFNFIVRQNETQATAKTFYVTLER